MLMLLYVLIEDRLYLVWFNHTPYRMYLVWFNHNSSTVSFKPATMIYKSVLTEDLHQ